MPHDKNGQLLQVGDFVTVQAKITDIQMSEDFCNVNMETVESMFPGTYKSNLILNSKQVEKNKKQ